MEKVDINSQQIFPLMILLHNWGARLSLIINSTMSNVFSSSSLTGSGELKTMASDTSSPIKSPFAFCLQREFWEVATPQGSRGCH
ncbi:hypothetical protein GX48_00797 [Paracoccidioides brasiliensis]|nr:hypothetical protein GX48_00797 [Paracoccidioides brasiliensis]